MENSKSSNLILEKRNIMLYPDDDPVENNCVYFKNTLVYGWGKNKHGELGMGHTENVAIPQPVKSLQNVEISSVSSGGKHTAIQTSDGKLYICGTDVLGLLGFENRKWKEQHKFQKMVSLDPQNITVVSCAEFHSLCLSTEGFVYTWGGNLHNINQAGIPMKLNALSTRKIVSISCGDYHSVALASSGEVFSWGGGGHYNRGQCGHGDLKDQDTPKRIDFFRNKRVTKVVCGGYHTIVLCEDNSLFGFGKGEYGQCGYGSSEDTAVPKLIKFSKKALHYERVTKNELNTNENLTATNFEETILNNTSSAINISPIIKDIKCGGEHTVVLTSFGRVFTFGHGYTGQLGLGNTKNFERPMIVKSLLRKTVNQIAAGWSHTIVLTSEGNVYVTGCGKYGELGLNDFENRRNFTLVRHASLLNVTNIFAGGHHSWLVIDPVVQERSDFEVPSPLAADNFPQTVLENSPKQNKTINKDNSLTNLKQTTNKKVNNNLKFNLDMLNEQVNSESSLLHVAYTDLKMIHRFVRFSIPKTSAYKDISVNELEAMVKDLYKNDSALVIFRLQDDKDVDFSNLNPSVEMLFKDFKSELKFLDMNFDKRSFSLTVLYDPAKSSRMRDLKTTIENIKRQNGIVTTNSTKSVYEVINVSEDDLQNSQIEEIMSSWFVDFKNYFSNVVKDDKDKEGDSIRFIELRPNCFYI